MFFAAILAVTVGSTTLVTSKTLAVQLALDRAGFSVNAADGQWGRKSQSALEWWASANGLSVPQDIDAAYAAMKLSPQIGFRRDIVTAAELASLVKVPREPSARAALSVFGYESILEMYAERGHVTQITLARLNPTVDFGRLTVGTPILLPDFPAPTIDLEAGKQANRRHRPQASRLAISLSRYEIVAFDVEDHPLAVFPCSIAKNKDKVPQGLLKVTTLVPQPNYTYTPDVVRSRTRRAKFVYPSGPNNPVGIAWIGLNLPGYGIHGTPSPETIGRPESHGCFRLANWNVARLFAIVNTGTSVEISE